MPVLPEESMFFRVLLISVHAIAVVAMTVIADIAAAVTAVVVDITADRAADRAAAATATLTALPAVETAVDVVMRAVQVLAAVLEADAVPILEVIELFVGKVILEKETHGNKHVEGVIDSRV